MRTLTSKLALASVLLTVLVAMLLWLVVTSVTQKYFQHRFEEALRRETSQVEMALRREAKRGANFTDAVNYVGRIFASQSRRLTLVAGNGAVVYDSEVPNDSLRFLENHLHREEIERASVSGVGTSERFSVSVHRRMLYCARKVESPLGLSEPRKFSIGVRTAQRNNDVVNVVYLRESVPFSVVDHDVRVAQSGMLAIALCLIAVVAVVSFLISRHLTFPLVHMAKIAEEIRRGDISKRIVHSSNDEIGALASTLNAMLDTVQAEISQLKKLERVRSEFLANVSHELRTPIFAMQGMLETLLNGAVDDPNVNREFLRRTLHNTERLNVLLGDLIDISRIESGEMKMSFRYFDVLTMLANVVSEMQPFAEQKNIRLRADFSGSVAAEIYGDRERLRQVVENLVDNAVKYSEPNTTVTISYRDNEHEATIAVADEGIGIAREHLPRIFERFYRVDKDRSREAGGTGLGLAIVKHILEAHHSSIQVKSEVGKGSVFTFVLHK
ncbi:MAG: HAMP domain-containing protein [Bacteroidota bacterium]|nr:HAMP domain-containing protein [Bacteroidota bacterium]